MNRKYGISVTFVSLLLFTCLVSCQTDLDSNSLLVYTKPNGKTGKIRTAHKWQIRYEQILDSMQMVMGPLPDESKSVPPDTKIYNDTIVDGVRRIKLSFASEKNDRVPAYLLMPEHVTKPVAAILCLHQTTESGKGEPAGLVFDKRIKAVVTSCGFTSFYKYYNGNLSGWSHKGYMPRIADIYNSDPGKMPFDFDEILAALAPAAIFINAPLNDSNFEVSGVHDCVNAALQVYKLFGAEDKIILKTPDAPHDFPPAEREEAYLFFDRELNMNKR